MSGIFGIFSKEDCVNDLFLGTHYLQHRAQDYCGLALLQGESFDVRPHKGRIREKFGENLDSLRGSVGIGCVASERQPLSSFSGSGGMILSFDGNIINYLNIRDKLLSQGMGFSGYKSPEEINDIALVSKIVSGEPRFVEGIKRLVSEIKGDFAIVALRRSGIYVARGWGRKPLILGKKDGAYAVSSESNSFENTGFEIVRDVRPGEIILINENGINPLEQLDLSPIKYGTFEWIYTAQPASVIDGISAAQVRKRIGAFLAEEFPVDADIVSPTPKSGIWHAIGFAEKSKIPYIPVFIRYDYSDRSYTPREQQDRDFEAKTKLIPVRSVIKGMKIILVDDSIVRGTQMMNRVKILKELGAKEVHLRIACPPLMAACKYGKTTKKDEDCIARRISVEDIKKGLGVDSLKYANVEMLEKATGYPREKLCLSCWGCDTHGD